jgi:hypothetical protein
MPVNRGSGRPSGPPELRRSCSARVMLRPGEWADLVAISEAWGVPPATAAWAIVSEQIAKWRGLTPNLGREGLQIAAASHALQRAGISGVEPTE